MKSILFQKFNRKNQQVFILSSLIILSLIFTLLSFWPGSMSVDSDNQMQMALSGSYKDHHPPIMSFLMRLMNHLLWEGSSSMLLFHVLSFYGGLWLLAMYTRRYSFVSALLLSCIGLTPTLLGNAGVIWKDVGLYSVAVLAIGIYYTKSYLTPALRWVLYILCLIYCVGIRHNALIIVLPLIFFAVYWEFWQHAPLKQRLIRSVGVTTLATFFFLFINSSISKKYLRSEQTNLVQALFLYDLGMFHLNSSPIDLSPDNLNGDKALEKLKSVGIDPRCHDNTFFGKNKVFRLSTEPGSTHRLFHQWWQKIKKYPFIYTNHRWEMFKSLLNVGYSRCRPSHLYFTDQPENFRKDLRRINKTVVNAMHTSFWFSPFFWLISAFALTLIHFYGIGRGKPLAQIGLLSSLTAITYLLPYYFISLCCDFRYTLLSNVFTMLSFAFLPGWLWPFKKDPPADGRSKHQSSVTIVVTTLFLIGFCKLSFSFATANVLVWPFATVNGYLVRASSQEYGAMSLVTTKDKTTRFQGRGIETGIRVHAKSSVTLESFGFSKIFRGMCAYPDGIVGNSMQCVIKQKDKILYSSSYINNDNRSEQFKVDIDTKVPLILEVHAAKPDYISAAHLVWILDASAADFQK